MWLMALPLSPSLNLTMRLHHFELSKLKKAWWWQIQSEANRLRIPRAKWKRNLTVTRFSKGTLDYDDFVGGCKNVIIDLLRPPKIQTGVYRNGSRKGQPWRKEWLGTGLIMDDSPTWLTVTYLQAPCPKGQEPRTEVLIEEDPSI